MKISRKLQLLVETKIRHGLATGALPVVDRSSATGPITRPGPDKAGGTEKEQAK
jgi:hypothetical protein